MFLNKKVVSFQNHIKKNEIFQHLTVSLLMNSFKPNILFAGGIRQTLLGHFSNLATPPEYQTIVVPLEGSESIICHHDNSQLPMSAPILMLFHGLGGCSESPYMLSISKAAAREHIRVIRFNHRGCGQGAGLAKKIYHSGRTKDMMLAIESIVNKFSEAPIFLCGFLYLQICC